MVAVQEQPRFSENQKLTIQDIIDRKEELASEMQPWLSDVSKYLRKKAVALKLNPWMIVTGAALINLTDTFVPAAKKKRQIPDTLSMLDFQENRLETIRTRTALLDILSLQNTPYLPEVFSEMLEMSWDDVAKNGLKNWDSHVKAMEDVFRDRSHFTHYIAYFQTHAGEIMSLQL